MLLKLKDAIKANHILKNNIEIKIADQLTKRGFSFYKLALLYN